MNEQNQRDLKDLRQAAQERNQQELQFLVKRLLQSLDYYVALAVPLERVYAFLEIFESYYPDEKWVRTLILAISSYGLSPDDSIAEQALLQQTFNEAGMANFLKAVYDITQAMQKSHTPEARIGFLTSAIVNIIMAELVEAWYGEHEDLWAIVRTNDFENPEVADIAYQFWTDNSTAVLDTACWLEIVQSLETKLQR